jgi:hypothetical protein
MTQELFEMSFSEREAIVKRISEIMRDEFGVTTDSIDDFWAILLEGMKSRKGDNEE